ncbi:uncharacterized protein LOC132266632 [Cornus florida]|uniref:uncharacterized protein LOC132266632 n=1 Tax=Cornus florida TaxID=4283 RepID=UPI00289FA87D|nr:uncharacterized protein LOC132266632 [Cornus florida]
MAAIPPISTWIPEDDLLLKNAVEAGASLEALAKGAVQFSRRFTLQELRDRWHSLLYDPDISAEASARMVELERSASNLSSKLNRLDNSKENKYVPEKRKVSSIHRQYYAMRKRIRSDFLASTDIGLLSESNPHDCGGNVGDFQEHVKLGNDPLIGNCMLGDCISNHFGDQKTDFDIPRDGFPQTMRDIAAVNAVGNNGDAFHTGNPYSLEDNRITRNDSLFRFPKGVSSLSIKVSVASDGRESIRHNDAYNDITHTTENVLVDVEKCSGVEETGPSQGLSDGKLLEADVSGTKLLCTFNSINDSLQNVCSEFGERPQFNSPDSDYNASLHTMGYSSPLPREPLWKTMVDISTPAMPVDMNLGDKSQCVQHMSTLPDNDDSEKKSYDVVHSGPLLGDRHNGDICTNPAAISDGENVDISDSLLNFSIEDGIPFVDADGKDMMDKSCYDNYNSLPLNSPNDIYENNVPVVKPEALTVSSTCLATPGGACPAKSEVISSPLHSFHGYQQSACRSEVNVPSTSVLCSKSLELNDMATYCTLNTEDPDIPYNDDIFLLIHPSASFTSSATAPITANAFDFTSSFGRDRERPNLTKKGDDPATSFTSLKIIAPNMLPETGPGHALTGCEVKSELSDPNYLVMVPRKANKALNSIQCKSAQATPRSAKDGTLDKEVLKVELGMVDAPATLRELPLNAEAASMKMTLPESVAKISISEHEEYESDNDVPYFSDIEAMILEMDLGPYDQDSYVSRQVPMYQHEDSRRKIIRLEQCAHASLHRAMASRGALAIFYGRQLKHYIRKTEVLLGRSTDDIKVDIDLGKEGRANKISRRQGIIKMGGDGSFFYKNLGKSSISVNGKEIETGQSVCLSTSCLIEIRGMSFVFETNHKYVRRYLDNIAIKSHGKHTNFEWSAEG